MPIISDMIPRFSAVALAAILAACAPQAHVQPAPVARNPERARCEDVSAQIYGWKRTDYRTIKDAATCYKPGDKLIVTAADPDLIVALCDDTHQIIQTTSDYGPHVICRYKGP